jgi:hypothetical protein
MNIAALIAILGFNPRNVPATRDSYTNRIRCLVLIDRLRGAADRPFAVETRGAAPGEGRVNDSCGRPDSAEK